MQKIREALRLHSEADMAVRQICVSVGASVGTVQSWLSKTRQAHLGWQLALQMSDEELAVLIYGDEGRGYRQPDWQWIHQELKIKGVTRASCCLRNIGHRAENATTIRGFAIFTATGSSVRSAPCVRCQMSLKIDPLLSLKIDPPFTEPEPRLGLSKNSEKTPFLLPFISFDS